MKSENFWKILVVFLVMLNMATLGFLVLKPNGNEHFKPNDQLLIDGLKLDAAQTENFQKLKFIHRHQMDSMNQLEAQLRNQVILEIQKGNGNDSLLNQQIQDLAGIKYHKDQLTLFHFRELYGILRPDQQPYYGETIEKLANSLMRGGKRPPHQP